LATISSTDIAFEGFKLAREQPRAILAWALLNLVFGAVGAIILVSMAGTAIGDVTALSADPEADPAEVLAAFSQLAGVYVVLLPLMLLFYGVLYSAVNRAVLRPQEGGFGFLRVGAAELRMAVVLLLYALIIAAIGFAGALVIGLITGFAAAANPALGGLLGFLGFVALLGACAWVGVRLSLCTPMTFFEDRIRLTQSWALTRGRFWPLFGGYVLAVIVAVVVMLLGLIIYAALAALLGGGLAAAGQAFSPDYTSVAAYFSAPMLVYLVVNALLTALTFAITAGAPAEAYRQISGGAPGASAEVFA
jgi:hypothetical protein